LAPGEPRIVGEAPSGRLHMDGEIIVPAEAGPVRIRRKLSFAGVVMVSLALESDGKLRGDLKIATEGLPILTEDGEEMQDIIRDAVETTLDATPRPRRKQADTMEQLIAQNVRRAVNMVWGKKPICRVMLHRL